MIWMRNWKFILIISSCRLAISSFACLLFSGLHKNMSLTWRHQHCQLGLQNIGLRSTPKAFEHGGIFIVSPRGVSHPKDRHNLVSKQRANLNLNSHVTIITLWKRPHQRCCVSCQHWSWIQKLSWGGGALSWLQRYPNGLQYGLLGLESCNVSFEDKSRIK